MEVKLGQALEHAREQAKMAQHVHAGVLASLSVEHGRMLACVKQEFEGRIAELLQQHNLDKQHEQESHTQLLSSLLNRLDQEAKARIAAETDNAAAEASLLQSRQMCASLEEQQRVSAAYYTNVTNRIAAEAADAERDRAATAEATVKGQEDAHMAEVMRMTGLYDELQAQATVDLTAKKEEYDTLRQRFDAR